MAPFCFPAGSRAGESAQNRQAAMGPKYALFMPFKGGKNEYPNRELV
jgi:hypothetical protein